MNKKLKKGLTTTMAAAMGLGVVIPAVPVIAAPATSGWVNTAAGWTYYKAGTKVASTWVSYNGKWYYIDANGTMAIGWRSIGGSWYYMDGNGVMQTNWYKDTTGTWYYSNANGDMVANKWVTNYYLGASGAMLANTLTPDNYYVDANGAWDGKAKYDLTAVETAVAKAEASKAQADVDAAKALVNALPAVAQKDAFTTRLNAIDTKLQVTSVSAANGITLNVTFNKPVNAASALVLSNYKLGGTAIASGDLVDSVATLSADKCTVTFNFLPAKALAADTPKYFEVSGVQDLEDKTVESYKQIFVFTDNTPATLTGVTNPSNSEAVVGFSEPMKAITAAQVQVLDSNNQVVTAPATATALGDTEISIDTSNLDLNKTYTVKIYNAEDLYGNFAGTYTTTITKTTTDSTAPSLVSIASAGLGKVKLTFNEPVKGTAGTISVAGGTALALAAGNTTVSSDKKTLTVTLDATNTHATAGLYTVALANIEDVSGNKLTSASLLTNFTADTTAPKVASTKVSNGKLYVTFDESVAVQAVADMLTPVTYVYNYVENTRSANEAFTAYDPDGDSVYDTIALDLSGFNSGAYTATLKAGSVKDVSANTNSNADTTITFNYTLTDSNKPVVYDADADSSNGYSGITQVGNVVTVVFDRALDSASALNLANYTVDGVAAFKSAIFSVDTKTVKLTLNNDALANPDLTLYQFAIKNVKSATGVAMDDFVYAQAFNNTVAPKVLTAKVTSSTTIDVTFTKAVSVSANAFDLYIGGTKIGTATNAAVLAGSETNSITLTVPAGTTILDTDFTKGITIQAVSGAVIQDATANTNALVTGVSVPVTR